MAADAYDEFLKLNEKSCDRLESFWHLNAILGLALFISLKKWCKYEPFCCVSKQNSNATQ